MDLPKVPSIIFFVSPLYVCVLAIPLNDIDIESGVLEVYAAYNFRCNLGYTNWANLCVCFCVIRFIN